MICLPFSLIPNWIQSYFPSEDDDGSLWGGTEEPGPYEYPERGLPAAAAPCRPIEGPREEPGILRSTLSNKHTRAIDKEGYAYSGESKLFVECSFAEDMFFALSVS